MIGKRFVVVVVVVVVLFVCSLLLLLLLLLLLFGLFGWLVDLFSSRIWNNSRDIEPLYNKTAYL